MSARGNILRGLLFLAACLTVGAQPRVEIYWDETNKADTVMDFGVTLEGTPVTLTFTVVNNDNVPVGILNNFGIVDPYYQIINTPEVPPESPRKEEFIEAQNLPYVIDPGERRSFGVTYRSLPNSPLFPIDVVTEALLELRVVKMTDTLGTSTNERFRLRAMKTRSILGSTTPWVRFDSVYVNPKPLIPNLPYKVDNVAPQHVPVDRQIREMITSVIGTPEITVDTFPAAEFGPRGSLTWAVRYAPVDRGRDSALFHLVYRPNRGATIQDTLVSSISGIGVEQVYRAIDVYGDPQAVALRTDTVDFGDVNADGSGGVTARIIFRNSGNINVHVTNETELGTPRDTLAYKVERSLLSNGAACATNAFDTLIVRFDPVEGGTHVMRYDITTDLRSRPIMGVPDGAQTTTLYFRGFARKPQLQVSPSSIDFGTVVILPTCTSSSERQLTVRNVGNVALRVDSIVMRPAGVAITAVPANAVIEIAEQQVFTLRYAPSAVETLNGSIVLYTNAFGIPYEIAATGASVLPDTITVSIPQDLRLKPGTVLSMPILVDADRVPFAENARSVVSFDPTLLKYRGSRTSNTAAEGATIVRLDESPRGELHLELDANGAFLPRDTMIVLLFDTYLGDRQRTELAISDVTTQFGNAGCPSVLDVTAANGSFEIDSVCGLSYKTAAAQGFVVSASVFPNPASTDAQITFATGEQQDITINIIDHLGRPSSDVQRPTSGVLRPGLTLESIDVSQLNPGLYFIDVRTPYQRLVLPLQVAR